MNRTQSAMNKVNPNQPEWGTTINLDIFDESESILISVYLDQMAEIPKLYANS